MADINPRGIDLVTGRVRPIYPVDIPTDTAGDLLIGYSGLRGVTGFIGETGIANLQGFSGLRGQTGTTLVGGRGLTGIQGVSGAAPGATGRDGRTGVFGFTGLQGPTGIIGLTGLRGVGNYALLFSATTINATTPAPGPYLIGVTGGGFTITLPTVASLGRRELIFQDEVGFSGTSNTTIAANAADTINGAANIVLNRNFEAIKLVSNGANLLIAQRILQGNTGLVGATGINGATGLDGITGMTGETGL